MSRTAEFPNFLRHFDLGIRFRISVSVDMHRGGKSTGADTRLFRGFETFPPLRDAQSGSPARERIQS
jgi:hypothetical protein